MVVNLRRSLRKKKIQRRWSLWTRVTMREVTFREWTLTARNELVKCSM
jgi:hypothetical protein